MGRYRLYKNLMCEHEPAYKYYYSEKKNISIFFTNSSATYGFEGTCRQSLVYAMYRYIVNFQLQTGESALTSKKKSTNISDILLLD